MGLTELLDPFMNVVHSLLPVRFHSTALEFCVQVPEHDVLVLAIIPSEPCDAEAKGRQGVKQYLLLVRSDSIVPGCSKRCSRLVHSLDVGQYGTRHGQLRTPGTSGTKKRMARRKESVAINILDLQFWYISHSRTPVLFAHPRRARPSNKSHKSFGFRVASRLRISHEKFFQGAKKTEREKV